MNILHHKSWHVRNKNNIQRVRRDEENARKEESERERRLDLADSERRIAVLRQKSGKTGDNCAVDVEDNANTSGTQTHLNIFEDFSDKMKTTNKEYEKEVKEEKERFETKTGILQYLVDKETISCETNWYLDSHEKRMNLLDNQSVGTVTEKHLKDQKLKKMNDPIEDMKKYLNAMKTTSEDKSIKRIKTKEFVKSLDKMKVKSKKSKKHRKEKKHKKKKRKRNSSQSSDDSDDNTDRKVSKTLEQLRAERLERERVEKERTRALLSGGKAANTETVIFDDRLRKYNSQFNPEIARQNSDKH